MKKFISMVMAAAMVVSLVPATAFAANTATFKVVNDVEYTTDAADTTTVITGPELQIKVKDVDNNTAEVDTWDITLDFNGAELKTAKAKDFDVAATGNTPNATVKVKEAAEAEDDSIKLVVTETDVNKLEDDDIIVIDMEKLGLVLTKDSAGAKATVEVSGDFGDTDALTFATVKKEGLKVTLKKVAEVAEEDTANLEKNLKIEAAVGNFVDGQRFELRLSSGFEFSDVTPKAETATTDGYDFGTIDDNKVIVTYVQNTNGVDKDSFEIDADDIEIEAVSAKTGAVAKLTVKALKDNADGSELVGSFKATADAVDAAKVVGELVTIEVDEDDDVPVIYSGVDVDNHGITDDSDHEALEVTIKESTKGALDVKKSFTLTLPEGVYATNVEVTNDDGVTLVPASLADAEAAFKAAYEKGEYDCFEFARRTFTDTTDVGEAMELSFKLTLVAEPGFEGDVTLTLGGDAFENEAEVVIAKFVSPYTVEAAQNDLIIDYRNTEVPTDVVVKEAEAGLWAKGLNFIFDIEKMEFEDDATYTVDDKSEMEIKTIKNVDMGFVVDEESDNEPAEITISGISLYMERNIPAGAYALELSTNAAYNMYLTELATEEDTDLAGTNANPAVYGGFANVTVNDDTVYTVADYKDYVSSNGKPDIDTVTVKEGFVNVITAGRDQDDASFTKKVVVPVGEAYIVAGEETVALDVPAYISAAGYTMLPVRAVAVALGINNNNVLWDQATKTVTILYGQRIITMVAGQKVVYVNGSAIPASASVEIKDGRTFLPMRDLATALGVTDITWDAATKTATLNGSK